MCTNIGNEWIKLILTFTLLGAPSPNTWFGLELKLGQVLPSFGNPVQQKHDISRGFQLCIIDLSHSHNTLIPSFRNFLEWIKITNSSIMHSWIDLSVENIKYIFHTGSIELSYHLGRKYRPNFMKKCSGNMNKLN